MFRARFGDDHPETAMGEYSLAGNFLAWKKYAEAEQARRQSRTYLPRQSRSRKRRALESPHPYRRHPRRQRRPRRR
jgi:hypothetical protein